MTEEMGSEFRVEGLWTMIIKPAAKMRGRHSLRDLVACIAEDYRVDEVDRGRPIGGEDWQAVLPILDACSY